MRRESCSFSISLLCHQSLFLHSLLILTEKEPPSLYIKEAPAKVCREKELTHNWKNHSREAELKNPLPLCTHLVISLQKKQCYQCFLHDSLVFLLLPPPQRHRHARMHARTHRFSPSDYLFVFHPSALDLCL